jgi:hypothetical protein
MPSLIPWPRFAPIDPTWAIPLYRTPQQPLHTTARATLVLPSAPRHDRDTHEMPHKRPALLRDLEGAALVALQSLSNRNPQQASARPVMQASLTSPSTPPSETVIDATQLPPMPVRSARLTKLTERRRIVVCDCCHRRGLTAHNPRTIGWHREYSPEHSLPEACELCHGALDAPLPIHHGPGFLCGACNRRFPRSDKFLAHSNMHTGVNLFHCELCPRTFSRNERLVEHLAQFHAAPAPAIPL